MGSIVFTLSSAFLRAAANGEFMEPWHVLAQALFDENSEEINAAITGIARFGASSGLDALAGFAAGILSAK